MSSDHFFADASADFADEVQSAVMVYLDDSGGWSRGGIEAFAAHPVVLERPITPRRIGDMLDFNVEMN